MQLASNIVNVAAILRNGAPVNAAAQSARYVHLDANGVGYVLRKGRFCPIVGVSPDGKAVTIETISGALPESAALKRAPNPQANPAQPAPAKPAPAKPVRGAAANAPAKGSAEAKAKMAELRAKRADKPAAPTLDAISAALAQVASAQAQIAQRMDAQEQAFAAFVATFAPRKRASKA